MTRVIRKARQVVTSALAAKNCCSIGRKILSISTDVIIDESLAAPPSEDEINRAASDDQMRY